MKYDVLDCKMLRLVYDRSDWNSRCWCMLDFVEHLHEQPATIAYHVRKLEQAGFLKEVSKYPKFVTPTTERREEAEKIICNALKYLLRGQT